MVDRGPGNPFLDRKHDFEPFFEVQRLDSYRMAGIFRSCDDFWCTLNSRYFEPERVVGPLARVLVS